MSKIAKVIDATVGPIVKALTPKPRHICDPSGFRCDCRRRREINAGSREPRWLDSPKWRERGRWL